LPPPPPAADRGQVCLVQQLGPREIYAFWDGRLKRAGIVMRCNEEVARSERFARLTGRGMRIEYYAALPDTAGSSPFALSCIRHTPSAENCDTSLIIREILPVETAL
jgi:hypothetical protein